MAACSARCYVDHAGSSLALFFSSFVAYIDSIYLESIQMLFVIFLVASDLFIQIITTDD
jgi:hypothetical protein